MIELKNGNTYDLLPPNFKDNNEIKAVCYALDRLHERLYDRIKRTEIWSRIKDIDEDVADYLAAELQTPFYNQSLDLDTKRAMVARTLIWYGKLGTKEVIEDVLQLAFGSGEVSEWFEFDGQPFTFRVKISALLDAEGFNEFISLLFWVKNTRSWLESVTTGIDVSESLFTDVVTKSSYIRSELDSQDRSSVTVNSAQYITTAPIYTFSSVEIPSTDTLAHLKGDIKVNTVWQAYGYAEIS